MTGVNNWAQNVKSILNEFGFSYVWDNPINIKSSFFLSEFKQRAIGYFRQKWHSDIENNIVLNTLYSYIKKDFCLEPYLRNIYCKGIRMNICRIRISAHNLRIETGRYGRNRTQRNERLCQLCNLPN